MISTAIAKDAFEKKMEELKRDGFFIEYKNATEFWEKRILGQSYPTVSNFLVGSEPHKFEAYKYNWFTWSELPDWVMHFFNLRGVIRSKGFIGYYNRPYISIDGDY